MKHFTTEHEARAAIEAVQKDNPGSIINEVHVDSDKFHNWYVYVWVKVEGKRRILFRCTWSSPIVRFE